MTNLFHLPETIIRLLQDYLIDNGSINDLQTKFHRLSGPIHYFHDDREEGKRSWRSFLNISKSNYWKNVKKDLIFLSLNRYYSLKYIKNETFRATVVSMMRNPYYQLGLSLNNFNFTCNPDPFTIHPHGVRYLFLACNNWTHIPCIKNVYEVDLTSCDQLVSIDSIENVKIMKLKNCLELQNVCRLIGVEELNITGCDFFNLANLLTEDIKKLYFTYVADMGDLSNLPVTNLEFVAVDGSKTDCPNLSAFQHVRSLSLLNCNSFRDLTNWKSLISFDSTTPLDTGIENMLNLTSLYGYHGCFRHILEGNFQLLKNLKFLSYPYNHGGEFTLENISHIPNISLANSQLLFNTSISSNSLTHLQNATMLDFTGCEMNALTDISMLGKVHYLCFLECPSVTGFDGLGKGNIEFTISSNDNLVNVHNFGNMQKVAIEFCSSLKDITGLCNVPVISLKGCTQIKNFIIFQESFKTKHLNVTGCNQITDEDLYYFKHIPKLLISCCPLITNISMLTDCISIKAICCIKLESVDICGKSKLKIDLAYNKQLKIIYVNTDIHALSIYNIGLPPEIYNFAKIDSIVDDFYDLFCEGRKDDEADLEDFGYESALDEFYEEDDDEDDEDDEEGSEEHSEVDFEEDDEDDDNDDDDDDEDNYEDEDEDGVWEDASDY